MANTSKYIEICNLFVSSKKSAKYYKNIISIAKCFVNKFEVKTQKSFDVSICLNSLEIGQILWYNI
jgi:hypothetical protein